MPICFVLERASLYSAIDEKPKASRRLKRLTNIETHPRASAVVDHFSEDWSQLWWVVVEGNARLVDHADEEQQALELLVAKYSQYAEARPAGPVVAIDIDRWRSWSSTPGRYSY